MIEQYIKNQLLYISFLKKISKYTKKVNKQIKFLNEIINTQQFGGSLKSITEQQHEIKNLIDSNKDKFKSINNTLDIVDKQIKKVNEGQSELMSKITKNIVEIIDKTESIKIKPVEPRAKELQQELTSNLTLKDLKNPNLIKELEKKVTTLNNCIRTYRPYNTVFALENTIISKLLSGDEYNNFIDISTKRPEELRCLGSNIFHFQDLTKNDEKERNNYIRKIKDEMQDRIGEDKTNKFYEINNKNPKNINEDDVEILRSISNLFL